MFVEIPVFKLLAMMDYCNIANDKLDAQYYLDKLLCGCDSEGTSVHLGSLTSQPQLNKETTSNKSVKLVRFDVHIARTEEKMRQICAAVRAKWPSVCSIVLVHRIGDMEPKDYFMFVGVSSRNKPESSLAVDYAVQEMETFSVWKEEIYLDNTRSWTSTHECFWRLNAQERDKVDALVRPKYHDVKGSVCGRNKKRGVQSMYTLKSEEGQVVRNVPGSRMRRADTNDSA